MVSRCHQFRLVFNGVLCCLLLHAGDALTWRTFYH